MKRKHQTYSYEEQKIKQFVDNKIKTQILMVIMTIARSFLWKMVEKKRKNFTLSLVKR